MEKRIIVIYFITFFMFFGNKPIYSEASRIIINNQIEENILISFFNKKQKRHKIIRVPAKSSNYYETSVDTSKLEITYLTGKNKNKKQIIRGLIPSIDGQATIIDIKKEGNFTKIIPRKFYTLEISNLLSKDIKLKMSLKNGKKVTIIIPKKMRKAIFPSKKDIQSIKVYTRNFFKTWKLRKTFNLKGINKINTQDFKRTNINFSNEGLFISADYVSKKDNTKTIATVLNKTDKSIRVIIKGSENKDVNVNKKKSIKEILFKNIKTKIKSIEVSYINKKNKINSYIEKLKLNPKLILNKKRDLEISVKSGNIKMEIKNPKGFYRPNINKIIKS